MAFVNEYASDEDIEKYGLREIWDKYHPLRKGRYFGGNRPDWTIDREQNIFLMQVGQGRGEAGNKVKFLLWANGQHIVAWLEVVGGESDDLNNGPFKRVWDLSKLEVPMDCSISESLIINMLKSAVETYGYLGICRQVPNTTISFIF